MPSAFSSDSEMTRDRRRTTARAAGGWVVSRVSVARGGESVGCVCKKLAHPSFATNQHASELDRQVVISTHIHKEDSRILCLRERTNPAHKLQGKSKPPFLPLGGENELSIRPWWCVASLATSVWREGNGEGIPGVCSSPVMARHRSSDGGAGRVAGRAQTPPARAKQQEVSESERGKKREDRRRASGGEETRSTCPELLRLRLDDDWVWDRV